MKLRKDRFNIIGYTFGLIALLGLVSCSSPRSSFTVEDHINHAPAKINFKNESKNAEKYEWDFGDGNKSTESNPSHQYTLSGAYTIKLKALKGKKMSETEQQIHLKSPQNCQVLIETEFGNMLIELYDATPLHRDNFLKLAEEGYFDNLLFHRVIEGFMLQGGDPNSRDAKPGQQLGMGGPGYQIPAEFRDSLVHLKGALAAARTGGPSNPQKQSSGSQFYIVQGRPVNDATLDNMEAQKGIKYSQSNRDQYKEVGGTPFLDMEYTVFGRVISGLDVIDKIAAVKTQPGDRPVQDVKMKIKVVK